MGRTFQDQLLQLGLVDSKKVKLTKQQQHRDKKQRPKVGKKGSPVDENALLIKRIAEKKRARVQKLNQQREAKLKKRAENIRISQLVEQHQLEIDAKGAAYHFNVKGKIQRIFVSREIVDQLSKGYLGIVHFADTFAVIPRKVIEQIQSINGDVFVSLNTISAEKTTDSEDSYADYQVPDDLVW